MFKLPLLLIIGWLSGIGLLAQGLTDQLEITPFSFKVSQPLYSTVVAVDSRQDTVIGKVQVGLLKNLDASLILQSPLQTVVNRLMDSLTGRAGGNGSLVFQLRDFNFVEEEETRYCYLIATLYAAAGPGYKKLLDLDTVIIMTAGNMSNIRRMLTPEASNILADFMVRGLVMEPTDSVTYNLDDIRHIDNIEKRRIPVYNDTSYVDGIYFSYAAFQRQWPDRQAMVKEKKDHSIVAVTMLDAQAHPVKVKPGDIYALVSRGKPFIATPYGYYPLVRFRNELFFTGQLPVAHLVSAPTAVGIIPGIIYLTVFGDRTQLSFTPAMYDAIIDYRTGNFIRLNKIVDPSPFQ